MNRGPERARFLLFRSACCVGAVPLSDVREIMRPLPLEGLADAPPFILGVAIIRGSPAPVIDAGRLLSSTPSTIAPTRFVALKLDARSVALAVDCVLDIRALPADSLTSVPPLLAAGAGASALSLIGALDQELLMVLNAARVVPDSVWNSL